MFLRKIFRYFEPMWQGNDKKVSLRALLAIAFSIDFIHNLSHAIWKWDAGRSLEGLSLALGIEAGLIVGLLGLTTYQNMAAFGKTVDAASNQPPSGDDCLKGVSKEELGDRDHI